MGIKSMVLSHIPTLGIMESTPPTTNQDTMGQETSLAATMATTDTEHSYQDINIRQNKLLEQLYGGKLL